MQLNSLTQKPYGEKMKFPLLCFSLAISAATFAQSTSLGVATTNGDYALVVQDSKSVGGSVGRWDTPFTEYDPSLEPTGYSSVSIPVYIDTNGGTLRGAWAFQTYDAGIWDWYDIIFQSSSGQSHTVIDHFGKPGSEFGTFWSSPQVEFQFDLAPYKGQQGELVLRVMQDGYGDQTQGTFYGIQVSGTCPLAALNQITDPAAIDFENGNRIRTDLMNADMIAGLQCLQTRASNAGGSLRVTSAFRPPEYQRHLREVWDKHFTDDYRDIEACNDVYSEIDQEYTRHGLLDTQRPAASSAHTRGEAFDANWTLPATTTIDILANQCQLQRPYPTNDRVHFTHQ